MCVIQLSSAHAASSWSTWTLTSEAARAAADRIIVLAPAALWDEEGPLGMQEMIAALREYRPDAPIDDVYVIGWSMGYAATAILEQAVADGDLTRAGVLEAARRTTVDFKDLAPNLTWSGEPDDNVVRASYVYGVTAAEVPDLVVSEVGTSEGFEHLGPQVYYVSASSVSDVGASTGFVLLEGPYTSDVARDWTYQPCHEPSPR